MRDAWAASLASFIQREVSKDSRQTIEVDTPLISSGLVDSFSLMKVLVFIEDEFGVVIPDEAATAAAMDSVALMLDLMDRFSESGDA
jgi:acyl carrier protein